MMDRLLKHRARLAYRDCATKDGNRSMSEALRLYGEMEFDLEMVATLEVKTRERIRQLILKGIRESNKQWYDRFINYYKWI